MLQDTAVQGLWPQVKDELQSLFPSDIFDTWFAPIKATQTPEDTLVLQVPNDFSVIWIKDNYLDLIAEKASKLSGRIFPIDVIAETPSASPSLLQDNEAIQPKPKQAATAPSPSRERSKKETRLNPRNTFNNFVIGAGNQLAHAASTAVGKTPAKAYNPLFLYGETGLGKTHLLHAVGHYSMENNPDAKVAYVSCEKFTNEFIRAIQENTLTRFRRRYRTIDILLIDDIHFLAGKERIQEEFFHTFNELYESQRQICLSSDRPASEITRLEQRLISRFQWGLVTDIQPPDFETRIAILKKKAQDLEVELSAEIIEFLAKRITRNVRRLEGALTRAASYATFMNERLDIPALERLLRDVLQEEAQNRITLEKIQKRVVDYYQLRTSDMVSRRRTNNIVIPRQIAMYLSRNLTQHSLQEIGEAFGGRDHGTIIHACKAVDNMMEQDHVVKRSVEYLSQHIATNSGA